MTKIRKNVVGAILCLVMLLVGVCALAACGSKELSVTFTVEGKTQTVEVVNGKVTMPADPEKEFYEFRGWYTTSTFDEGTEFTKDAEVKENLTVYAYFAPIHVGISVNGEAATDIKLEDLSSKTTEYTEDAASKNLTFDGWYIDAAYGTKYVRQDTDNLYARYCATVTFDNGYEVLKTVQVGINSTIKAPDKEYEDFVPYYMDTEDLSYVDEEGKTVDFASLVITKNTAIKVMWKSPYLAYQKIEGTTNDYVVVGFDYKSTNSEEWQNIKRFPAISFLSKATINGVKDCNVVAVDFAISSGMYVTGPDQCDSVVYASFADGIQYINRFQTCGKLENVKLPATLKAIEKSFWNMKNLKSLELPDGLEIVIDSFWGDYMEGMVGYYRGASAFPFAVNVPASVKTVVTVPSNLKFAEGSEYYYENGELFRNRVIGGVTYKTLVCTYQAKVADETITVAEGVEAVAVGAFKDLNVKYISLPSTFKAISYASDENNKTYELSYYTGSMLTDMLRVKAPDEKSTVDSYSVFGGLMSGDFGYVYINAASMPEGISIYAFTQGKTPYTELTDNDGTPVEKVVCVGAIPEGDEVIVHIIGEDYRDLTTRRTYSLTGKKSGEEITEAEILNVVGITANDYIYKITELGGNFEAGVITHNLYLRVSYTNYILGVTYTVDEENKIITVTGFDQSSAKDIGGVYRINVDFSGDEKLADYKVVIADGAFKDNNYISEVYVGSQVTSIGAEAFANTSNLTKFIVSDGGLEEVKTKAFENAGCVVDGETVTINENIKKKGIEFVLPLAKMKSVEPYAFKTKGIVQFTPTDSEENDDYTRDVNADSKEGEYYFVRDAYSKAYGILRYLKNTETRAMKDNNGNDNTVVIYDVQYVATAGGFNNKSGHMGIGKSDRNYGCLYGDYSPVFAEKKYFVQRYEVMEGSVYYLGNAFNYISFGIFTKIHKNAFTDMEETNYAFYNNCSFDIWMDENKVKNQDASLFEEGWFEGRANSENTFMSSLEDHEDFYL